MFGMKYNPKSKIWRGDETPTVLDTKSSLGLVLLKALENNATKIAQISDNTGERFTCDEIRMMTIRSAQNLRKLGYKEGQVVGIMAGNVPHLAPIVLASLCIGCPINSIDPDVEKGSVLRMFESTQPEVLFCEARLYDMMTQCLKELGKTAKIFTFNGTKGTSVPVESLFVSTGTEEEFVPTKVDGENVPAFIMSTSGSTGPSKGVCISHASFISEIDATSRIYSDGVILSFSSIYWLSGLILIVMGTYGASTRIITTEYFTPTLQFSIIERHKVTVINNQSYYLILMAKSGLLPKANLSSVKTLISTGFKIPFSVLDEVNKHLPNGSVSNAYGLTELGDSITIDYPHFSGNDTVGRFVNGYSVKIVNDEGERCGTGVNGEICIKGRVKFLGYYKNQQLTDEAVDSEGFFRTGDIGYIDEKGYLYIADRKKNTIFYYVHQIFPSEIEEVLLKSLEIKNVCVVGVPLETIIELPAAVIVRAKGSKMSEKDVCQIVSDNMLDHYKLRGGVYFTDIIPTTTTGKPNRNLAKEYATQLYQLKIENERCIEMKNVTTKDTQVPDWNLF